MANPDLVATRGTGVTEPIALQQGGQYRLFRSGGHGNSSHAKSLTTQQNEIAAALATSMSFMRLLRNARIADVKSDSIPKFGYIPDLRPGGDFSEKMVLWHPHQIPRECVSHDPHEQAVRSARRATASRFYGNRDRTGGRWLTAAVCLRRNDAVEHHTTNDVSRHRTMCRAGAVSAGSKSSPQASSTPRACLR